MTGKKQAKEQIAQLIEKYKKANKQGLNEANTRKDYILPLFAALGWRTDDSGEVAEEVKVGKDWADYAFKLGGVTRFYLEAKKAGADLENLDFAHQAVSYAYNKGASWAVLTHFEGLKLFNAEWDVREVNTLRVLDLHYSQYLDHFDDLWALSRESVGKDGLRTRFESQGGTVKKRLRVDERLFGLLKEWRLKLIQLFVQYQPPDTPLRLGEIDEAVQRILDRLIFIRTVEDRKIEDPILSPIHHLRMKGQGKESAWELLQETFRRLDDTYNSNLFARHLADDLPGDESAFLPILSQLYSPDGAAFRFDFSAIEADVLGRVYEQYLGHVIETVKTPTKKKGQVSYGSGDQLYIPGMQPANRELVEAIAKQAKRKQQGIYYTPKYIVDYIVEQTLGRLLDERGGDRAFVESIAVLDPACGSGSFLIAAYDRLLKHYAEVRQVPGGANNLSQDERVEILLRHIYGVDLDPQAVEIARLNLLLRALTEPKLLPEMGHNIVRGNSLIGGDAETLEAHFGPDWREMHPLNWEERFPKVMERGGFDVVIGNPPYVRLQTLFNRDKDYFQNVFNAASGNYDIYVLFIEQGERLLGCGGHLGYIVPNKFMTSNYGQALRHSLASTYSVERILNFKDFQVFEGATTYTCLLFIGSHSSEKLLYGEIKDVATQNTPSQLTDRHVDWADLDSEELKKNTWGFGTGQIQSVIDKLNQFTPLGEIASIFVGLQTSADAVYILEYREKTADGLRLYSKALERDVILEHDLIFPLVSGFDIKQYEAPQTRQFVLFPYRVFDDKYALLSENWIQENCPNTWEYLLVNKETLERRENNRMIGSRWYGFVYHKNMTKQASPKICVPRLVSRLHAFYDQAGSYFLDNVDVGGVILGHETHLSPQYVVGLLNSKLLTFYLKRTSTRFRGEYYSANKQYLQQIPIRQINFGKYSEVTLHKQFVAHVEALLGLHRRRHEATEHTDAWEEIGRQIGVEDAALDRLVYELYGLTEEEIGIVEGR